MRADSNSQHVMNRTKCVPVSSGHSSKSTGFWRRQFRSRIVGILLFISLSEKLGSGPEFIPGYSGSGQRPGSCDTRNYCVNIAALARNESKIILDDPRLSSPQRGPRLNVHLHFPWWLGCLIILMIVGGFIMHFYIDWYFSAKKQAFILSIKNRIHFLFDNVDCLFIVYKTDTLFTKRFQPAWSSRLLRSTKHILSDVNIVFPSLTWRLAPTWTLHEVRNQQFARPTTPIESLYRFCKKNV